MRNKNYPHPVLSLDSSDFKSDIQFDLDISVSFNNIEYKFDYSFNLNEYNMLDMISKNKSIFVIKVECTSTRYRKTIKLANIEGSFTLSYSDLKDKVTLSTFVVSTATDLAYFSNEFHDDYDAAVFPVYPGDILAEGPQFSLKLNESSDVLKKTSSIFRISLVNDKAKPDVYFEHQKIIIKLNKKDFDIYKSLKERQKQYPHLGALSSSLFILPAMTMLIEQLKKELESDRYSLDTYEFFLEEKESDFQWFKVLRGNLNSNNIHLMDTPETSLVIAQTLLGNPLSVGLNAFNEIFTTNHDGEEDII